MTIYDQQGVVMDNYNLELGHIVESAKIVHHDAVQPVEETGHYETVQEYPNGGKDVRWVVDVPGVQGYGAWDEQVATQTFVPYTEAELAGRVEARTVAPTNEQRLARIEEALGIV